MVSLNLSKTGDATTIDATEAEKRIKEIVTDLTMCRPSVFILSDREVVLGLAWRYIYPHAREFFPAMSATLVQGFISEGPMHPDIVLLDASINGGGSRFIGIAQDLRRLGSRGTNGIPFTTVLIGEQGVRGQDIARIGVHYQIVEPFTELSFMEEFGKAVRSRNPKRS